MATKRTPVPKEFSNEMSEPQESFIRSLLEERDVSNPYPDDKEGRTSGEVLKAKLDDPNVRYTKDEASAIIGWLMNRPHARLEEGRGKALPLPEGYYGVKMEGHKNKTTFYRLQNGKGRWEGYQFLTLQAGPNWHKVPREQRAKVLAEIRHQGILECQQRYGKEIGRCGICNLPLTDDVSRERGIGPVCWEKL
jgi:hypothetical protein